MQDVGKDGKDIGEQLTYISSLPPIAIGACSAKCTLHTTTSFWRPTRRDYGKLHPASTHIA